MRTSTALSFLFCAGLSLLLSACGGGSSSAGDSGASGTGDSDSDTDTDADSDTDADGDADSDADSDAGSDAGTSMTPADYDDPTPITWVEIDGGTYLQGSASMAYPADYSETPQHSVTVPSFQMAQTEVTCSQYAQCVLDGACAEPLVANGEGDAKNCNWLVWGRDDHPVNCVYVWDAEAYCAWLGGRLPSESEWEYAARSRGQDNEYPWGSAAPNCDYAVMNDTDTTDGCDLGHTWPVCSKPLGNTEQGLCDMAGNVKEWLPDCWHGDYEGSPTDGSPWVIGTCDTQVLRGGYYGSTAVGVRTRIRAYHNSLGCSDDFGFRCVKDAG